MVELGGKIAEFFFFFPFVVHVTLNQNLTGVVGARRLLAPEQFVLCEIVVAEE